MNTPFDLFREPGINPGEPFLVLASSTTILPSRRVVYLAAAFQKMVAREARSFLSEMEKRHGDLAEIDDRVLAARQWLKEHNHD